MNRKAIVTLVLGPKHERMFYGHCKGSWTSYCAKFGYDLRALDRPLDESERAKKRSPAWQKLLMLSQDWSKQYERIVWVDSDIIINNKRAADISEGVPVCKVGAVEAYSIPTREIHNASLGRQYNAWKSRNIRYIGSGTPGAYYEDRGIPGGHLDAVVQTGVLVCSPLHHRAVLERTYDRYEDAHGPEWNYEMPALSYELVKQDLTFWISPIYNFCVMDLLAAFYPSTLGRKPLLQRARRRLSRAFNETAASGEELRALKNIYELSAFMHFAGCAELIRASKPFTESL